MKGIEWLSIISALTLLDSCSEVETSEPDLFYRSYCSLVEEIGEPDLAQIINGIDESRRNDVMVQLVCFNNTDDGNWLAHFKRDEITVVLNKDGTVYPVDSK